MAKKTMFPGGIWEPGEPKYGSRLVEGLEITMADGVKLKASVAYPTDLATGEIAEEEFPVIVEYTCYDKLAGPVRPVPFYCEYGYIYAMVWIRGACGSGGEILMTGDVEDSRQVVAWARTLKGANGDVAFLGASYPAGMALVAAASNPEIKCIIATNNAFENALRQSWMISGVPTIGADFYTNAIPNVYGDTEASRRWAAFVQDNIENGGDLAYDRDFWSTRLPMRYASQIVANDTPVLIHTGYNDLMDNLIVKTFTALQNAYAGRPVDSAMVPGQKVSPKWQMIYGYWDHVKGLNAALNLQWLETWVRGVDTGLADTAKPMHLWEGGSNRWFNTDIYPISQKSTPVFFNAKGALEEAAGEDGSVPLKLAYPNEEGGVQSLRSEPLAEDITIAGPVSAEIYASTETTNLVLIANLYDQYGAQKEQVARGIVLGSQREYDTEKTWYDQSGHPTYVWLKLTEDDYLKPGKIYKLNMFLACRQWKFLKGHRLLVELSTKTPADICPPEGSIPRNGCEPGRLNKPQRESIGAGNFTVYFGEKYPSAIYLPRTENDGETYVEAGIPPYSWSELMRCMSDQDAYPIPLDFKS